MAPGRLRLLAAIVLALSAAPLVGGALLSASAIRLGGEGSLVASAGGGRGRPTRHRRRRHSTPLKTDDEDEDEDEDDDDDEDRGDGDEQHEAAKSDTAEEMDECAAVLLAAGGEKVPANCRAPRGSLPSAVPRTWSLAAILGGNAAVLCGVSFWFLNSGVLSAYLKETQAQGEAQQNTKPVAKGYILKSEVQQHSSTSTDTSSSNSAVPTAGKDWSSCFFVLLGGPGAVPKLIWYDREEEYEEQRRKADERKSKSAGGDSSYRLSPKGQMDLVGATTDYPACGQSEQKLAVFAVRTATHTMYLKAAPAEARHWMAGVCSLCDPVVSSKTASFPSQSSYLYSGLFVTRQTPDQPLI